MEKRFVQWIPPVIEEGKMTQWHWIVRHVKNFVLGLYTDIGAFCYINAKYGVDIGDNVQIGAHCAIYSVSTIDNKQGKVTLGKNVCIGAHTIIMPGVTIGEHSVIGAHSFVNKDIPSYVVAVGCPAKIIRSIR
ncbi:MAG: acetyltransferase [Candidatus Magasanikbacteria bacterium CG10_big_fil_rev_8_21_14_0_10_38_6]|uniref:Acetyltransferase n=1 Tax=Candidatus Magasanikbacteria bacterium CG10_big_fil_rev_8_21_14_0_10_38_6 TaxID=1974647 RepID=A0A2M6P268_9BACT|nr:MAG: acetyltransferase [Candidatus Magasanikbacteria bacterium CG10_big_fil_rev_8_21_14_0_10_38_6]